MEGRIEYRQWQDKDGQTRYSTEINVRELIMLSSRQGGGGYEGDEGGAPRRAAAPAPPRAAAANNKPAATTSGNEDFEDFPGALEDEDDDLPF